MKMRLLIVAVFCLFPLPALAGEYSVDELIKLLEARAPQSKLSGPTAKSHIAPTPQPKEAPKATLSAPSERGAPKVDLEIFFAYDSDVLKSRSIPQLMRLGAALGDQRLVSAKFLIAGHTDAKGSREYNADLSKRRAMSVKRFLLENFPMDSRRLVVIGMGEDELKAPSDPEAAINRRVEVRNIGLY